MQNNKDKPITLAELTTEVEDEMDGGTYSIVTIELGLPETMDFKAGEKMYNLNVGGAFNKEYNAFSCAGGYVFTAYILADRFGICAEAAESALCARGFKSLVRYCRIYNRQSTTFSILLKAYPTMRQRAFSGSAGSFAQTRRAGCLFAGS